MNRPDALNLDYIRLMEEFFREVQEKDRAALANHWMPKDEEDADRFLWYLWHRQGAEIERLNQLEQAGGMCPWTWHRWWIDQWYLNADVDALLDAIQEKGSRMDRVKTYFRLWREYSLAVLACYLSVVASVEFYDSAEAEVLSGWCAANMKLYPSLANVLHQEQTSLRNNLLAELPAEVIYQRAEKGIRNPEEMRRLIGAVRDGLNSRRPSAQESTFSDCGLAPHQASARTCDELQAFVDREAVLGSLKGAGLTDEQIEALLPRLVYDLSEKEIAEASGVPVGTIRSRQQRGLKKLRQTPPAP